MHHGSSNADPTRVQIVSHFLRDFGLGEGGPLLRFD